jgi:PAS domain S-box-containing protein
MSAPDSPDVVHASRREFLEALDSLGLLESLFENLPNLIFWVKDLKGRFVTVNQNMVKICRCRNREEVVGKTDFDVYPKHIAEAFWRDDLEVIRSGVRIMDRIEPITQEDGSISWYSTNKVPVYGRTGEMIGVAGTTRRLETGSSPDPLYSEFSQVIEFINRDFAQPIEIQQLARMASLSLSQFERRFKVVFQETPVRFILKIRINEACRLLVHTRHPLAWIARATGFFDQSYFSKQFSRRMGTSPRRYREKYYQGG